jgi:hypothetical protein
MGFKVLCAAVGGVLGTALVFAAVGFGKSNPTSSSSAATTMHLIEVQGAFHLVTDTPPKLTGPNQPFSPGDSFVFTSELRTPSGKHAGWLDASCIAITGGKSGVTSCEGVFRLAGGQLILAAAPPQTDGPTDIAIIGGTGAYAGVRGQVHSVTTSSTRNRDTVTFWK